jgi:hypothetical protein
MGLQKMGQVDLPQAMSPCHYFAHTGGMLALCSEAVEFSARVTGLGRRKNR